MNNYNNFHAQTESAADQKKIPIGFQTTQPKMCRAQGFLAFDIE
jgi:hypothetical protein